MFIPRNHDENIEKNKKIDRIKSALRVGDKVNFYWGNKGRSFAGKIVKLNPSKARIFVKSMDRTYDVSYLNICGKISKHIKGFKKGERVRFSNHEREIYKIGTIKNVYRHFADVKYDDGTIDGTVSYEDLTKL